MSEEAKCENRVCPYCGQVVFGWPEAPGCCGEVHAQECGTGGVLCSDCQEGES
jgi:hypothetical protein